MKKIRDLSIDGGGASEISQKDSIGSGQEVCPMQPDKVRLDLKTKKKKSQLDAFIPELIKNQ